MEEEGEPRSDAPKLPWFRLLVLVLFIAGGVIAARSLGLSPSEIVERLREAMVSAGPLGVGLFVVVFAVGELAHIPGVVFVAAAALAYGRLAGGMVGYAGAVFSVAVSFWVVRTIGGKALAAIERPWVRRILDRLESQPIRVIVILRLLLWMAPPLNYALAMSNVRFRDYIIGSAIGLVVPIALAATFLDYAIVYFLAP